MPFDAVTADADAVVADAATGSGPAPPVRAGLRSALELFALCGLAITQPVLDLFGRAPQQFAFRGVQGFAIIGFVVVVAVLPAAVLWVAEAGIGLINRRLGQRVHEALVGLLVAAIALQVVASLASGVVRVVVAVAAGVGAVMLYQRVPPVRTWLAYMAVAPVVFVGAFLLASPTARLLTSPSAAAVDAGVARPAPVVIIVFDELPLASLVTPDGAIDAELFPNFAALADRSSWFRNATSVSSSTWYAIPALVTGQNVQSGKVPVAADHPESLFTLLGGVYDLNVTESVTRLCPSELCATSSAALGGTTGLLGDAVGILASRLSYSGPGGDPVAALVEPLAAGEDVVSGVSDVSDVSGDAGGNELSVVADFELNQPERVGAFIDGIVDNGPALHYLHILLPHVPFRYLPSGNLYSGPEPDLGRNGDTWSDQQWLADLGRQRHLLQVGYVDAVLGGIVAELEARGVFDESLLIVTSDHGIGFEPGHPIRGLEGQPLDNDDLADLAWVPLFIKQPGQTLGEVSDANVLTVDVVPTIADVVGIDIPWQVDGQSVFGTPRSDPAKYFHPGDLELLPVALDPIRLDPDVDLTRVLRRGPSTLLGPSVSFGAATVPQSSALSQGVTRRWWSLGPAPELVGMPVGSVPGGRLTQVDATVADVGSFELAPGSRVVPALVRGRVDSVDSVDSKDSAGLGQGLAIAVNGVIVATAPTYADGDEVAFAVMVDAVWFDVGTNIVTVHRIG